MVAKLRYGANALLLRNTGIYGTPVWNTVRNVNDALNQELSWKATPRSGKMAFRSR